MGICVSKKKDAHEEPIEQPLREEINEEPFDYTTLRIKIPKDPYHTGDDKKTPWDSSPRQPPSKDEPRVAIRRVRFQLKAPHSA